MYNIGDLVKDSKFTGYIEHILVINNQKLYSIFWFDPDTIELQPFSYHEDSEFTLLNV